MKENNNLTHNGFSNRIKEAGLHSNLNGEVVASGQNSPESVLRAWLRSIGHRRILLNLKFNTIGLGYYQGYWGAILVRTIPKSETIQVEELQVNYIVKPKSLSYKVLP